MKVKRRNKLEGIEGKIWKKKRKRGGVLPSFFSSSFLFLLLCSFKTLSSLGGTCPFVNSSQTFLFLFLILIIIIPLFVVIIHSLTHSLTHSFIIYYLLFIIITRIVITPPFFFHSEMKNG